MINAIIQFLEMVCLANFAIQLTIVTVVIVIVLFSNKSSE